MGRPSIGGRERKMMHHYHRTVHGECILLNEGGTPKADKALLAAATRAATRHARLQARRAVAPPARRPAGAVGPARGA